MKFQLINKPDEKLTATQQLFINRGLQLNEIEHYMNLTDDDINSPLLLGEEKLKEIAGIVTSMVQNSQNLAIIVDADADGYTSSATLLNWFYYSYPKWTKEHTFYYLHDGKTHGLTPGAMSFIQDMGADVVWIPDAGSNDLPQIEQLYNEDRKIIITDHHIVEDGCSPYAITINSQIDDYPNKELTGAGVTWQVCRYLDSVNGTNYAEKLVDLVATGQIADMAQLSSTETRRIITKGLIPDNIINPYLFEMWQKNKFKLTDTPTDWGWTFYVCPMINAITRSGTIEEKTLIFESMLLFKAFEQIASNKRGHKPGEMERLVDQAVRTSTNVKNRQTRSEKAGMDKLESLIKENDMLKHKVLLFTINPSDIEPAIRGLVANKIMAKYQRCCAVLSDDGENCAGSMRGCGLTGIMDFKSICESSGVINWARGHENAAGLSIPTVNIEKFLEKTDKLLEGTAEEAIYRVDYIWDSEKVDSAKILDIADFDPYIGQGFPEPLVAIKNIHITKNDLTMMKSNTVKIMTRAGVPIICFSMPDEEYEKLYSENGEVVINLIGTANKNEWNGNVSAQILMKDYEIVNSCAYVF
jgi:single-stranded-DNA-specific exonuclease